MSDAPAKPRPVVEGLDLDDLEKRRGSKREVLVVGEIDALLKHNLLARGARLTRCDHVAPAFDTLAQHPFDVVVVDPMVDRCGLDFLSAVKESDDEHLHTVATLYGARAGVRFMAGVPAPNQEVLDRARAAHRFTPFVVLPDASSNWYLIVVSPPVVTAKWSTEKTPLLNAILTVTPASIFTDRTGLA